MDFGGRIKELLAERGWSQADLSKRSGLTSSHISQYSTGKRKPTLETAMTIAGAFGISLDKLVGWTPTRETAEEEKLLTMFREMCDTDRREIVDYVEYKYNKKILRKTSSKEVGETG